MEKKGHITTIILLALFISSILIIGTHISNNMSKSKIEQESNKLTNVDYIKSYVTSCLKDAGEDAFTLLGARGGFLILPLDVKPLYIENGNYLYIIYKQGTQYLNSLETTEIEVSNFVQSKIQDCFEDEDFLRFGKTVEYVNMPTVSTKIGTKNVLIKMKQFVEVKEYNNNIENLNEFAVLLPIRYGMIHETTKKIMNQLLIADLKRDKRIEEKISDKLIYPLSMSLNFMYYNDYPEGIDVKFYYDDGPITLWIIKDTISENKEYDFVFAALHMIKEI
ncbi:hypothetical protein HOD20_01555 [archaeon]|jgi:hypothetical protein|nr:hypothetical protein [archaeon]MBT4351190.1 hypothetical protein [archaeon]MBT4646792.1 hypothetical protein [archaeon]MBT6821468.1 hypothetical protein [archaeon]MBT7392950.1 hypothetical protein [archaeon]